MDNNEYLAHHGIIGQRWGVKNGPPYPLGEQEHASVVKKGPSKEPTKSLKDEILSKKNTKEKAKAAVKNINNLDNKDLQEIYNRLNLEQNVRDLRSRTKGKNPIEKTIDVVNRTVSTVENTGKLVKYGKSFTNFVKNTNVSSIKNGIGDVIRFGKNLVKI